MKTIGLVGSRRRDTREDFKLTEKVFYRVYEDGDRIVSGGCPQGGDRFADDIAKQRGLTIITHYPGQGGDRIAFAKRAFARNSKIADDCDLLIAVVSEDRRGGTEDTIKKVTQLGKTVYLVPLVSAPPMVPRLVRPRI